MVDTVIFWFRQDLRLADNPALCAAAQSGSVIPVYVLDLESAGDWKPGAASLCWLHHSLKELNDSLRNKLRLYRGDAAKIIPELTSRHGAVSVHWNRCYEPWRIARDKAIKADLQEAGVAVSSDNGSLLWEPWEVLKDDGDPYRVFTPFYKKGCLAAAAPRKPLDRPDLTLAQADGDGMAVTLEELDLLPKRDWGKAMMEHWEVGEDAAERRLEDFLEDGLKGYKSGRNFPDRDNVSRLSPHLHYGELSPNAAWYAVKNSGDGADADNFLSELAWREFSYSLLYHFPDLPVKNLQGKFDDFPWDDDGERLRAWRRGQTGIPIVDAGMRELWQTGYMHNRVRMVVGSFLVKNLLLHWREGEAWFWDCLVDADLANNSASWQWAAGCGADAAPYFRVFNPVLQGQKFDGKGHYTRRWVPELKDMPDKWLFNPWEAPADVLEKAGVKLGDAYPEPIVDLKESRERALEAFKQTKG
ncbi:MAG: deoxyribodipyrimidine photo-lyase [Rhizobiaceae bacterium MnEN-MB40S]|nr:MAG: deoxyribodipyrimidine photo-lyase [Rhizobiaceae bacterium MnEN-MB40S]